jgi:hypothetical protein
MKVEQRQWNVKAGWDQPLPGALGSSAQLVLVFGSKDALKHEEAMKAAREAYPGAQFFGCSTAGEILGTSVLDDTLVLTAIQFKTTRIQGAQVKIAHARESHVAGQRLSLALSREGLVHVMVLSDGTCVNGSDLVEGLTQNLPEHVTVTGGLSADGDRFQETLVLWDGKPEPNTIAAIGFYGEDLRVGYGSLGGWDPFGPERMITRSQDNVLYELDGRPALDLYREYLGEHAKGLPAAGLLFPLSLRTDAGGEAVVRTILGIDSATGSMTFAGDVPQGTYARLMKANFERLIDGAAGAAKTCHSALSGLEPDFAVLISCVGRKLVLKQRIEEEVEGVREFLGARPKLTGFYSYGEISPFVQSAKCELHNQTMTITAFAEV